MLKGLTKYGIGNIGSLENQVNLASKYGFHVVDTDGDALRELINTKGKKEAKSFLDESGIKIGAIQLPVNWKETDELFYEELPELLEDAKLAKEFDIRVFNTFFLPSTEEDSLNHLINLTNRMRVCCRLIKDFNCKIALEFVGPYHLRNRFSNEFIYDLNTTIKWISMIGEENIGVLLDSIHWFTTEGTKEDILALKPEQIAHVHINDAPDIPLKDILDNGRLYPGEGVIDLEGFLSSLKTIGYNGSITQEVLTKEETEETSEVLIKKSSELINELLDKIE
ncbi:sugar phosphate isomerase/epimerase family protein [Oceanobacillus neutriphilus]|uniref:Sugar phosphate isomerase n=1 Tax=Oceanobacillus neutriphilus TaxID=531815 RepID=A0ABQ2NW91_9BACI|nr:sugar phosphate isomerase/epimerase family protein [Oceanobacillus neutriphilus]GGP12072.1 sugar phosphate isomerase [Oceanobacillus neutriphilus]